MKPLLLFFLSLFCIAGFSQPSREIALNTYQEKIRPALHTSPGMDNSSRDAKIMTWPTRENRVNDFKGQAPSENVEYFENTISRAWNLFQNTGESAPLENAFALVENYRNSSSSQKLSIIDLQKRILAPDQTLLYFFTGNQTLFTFVITSDFFQVLEVRYDFPLDEWVRKMKKGILGVTFEQDDHFRERALDEYIDTGYALYEKLIAPVEIYLRQRIIISPDGPLLELPFEAMLARKPHPVNRWRFHIYEYFGQTCNSITYFHSTAMLNSNHEPYSMAENKFLIYAPSFICAPSSSVRQEEFHSGADNCCLSNLKYAAKEAKTVHEIMGGKVVIGPNATKTEWLQEASFYRFLHLSTHAKANERQGEFSCMAFSKTSTEEESRYLYADDIYLLRLNAELVVLSACETGIGSYVKGGPMISLANAFFHAGAKNVVTTLWAIDDEKTMKLMILFYGNLSKGMTKGAALAQAKRDYLTVHKGSEAQPYYWAGIVGFGPMN